MKELAMQAIALLKKAVDSGQLKDTIVGQEIEDWLNSTAIPIAGSENIVLDYPVAVQIPNVTGGSDVYYADNAEVFMDEHSVQWVKFYPKNGYNRGAEHMLRTDDIIIVRRVAASGDVA